MDTRLLNDPQATLFRACASGTVEDISLALSAGADVNALDRNRDTPAHIAGAGGRRCASLPLY